MVTKNFLVGKILCLALLLFCLNSCVRLLFLSIHSNDDRIVIQKEDTIEYSLFSEKGVNLKLIAGLYISPFGEQKKGEKMEIFIELSNSEDIKCNFLFSSLIDSSLMIVSPKDFSLVNKDGFYEKNEKHKIELVYQTNYDIKDYFDFPVKLKLPYINLFPMNDTLFIPEIVISIPEEEEVFE